MTRPWTLQQEPVAQIARQGQGGFEERSERRWLRENAPQKPTQPLPMRSTQVVFAVGIALSLLSFACGGSNNDGLDSTVPEGGSSATSSGSTPAVAGSTGKVCTTGTCASASSSRPNGSSPSGSGGTKGVVPSESTSKPAATGGSGATNIGGDTSTASSDKGGSSAAAGGSSAKGGSSASGGSSPSTTSSDPVDSDTTIPLVIPTPTASETRETTTVLPAGVHDLQNKRVGVKSTKSCDGEGQPAVFELEDGATLKNVIIEGGMAGGNGVVCKGNCTLDHVYWEDVCEDAATNSKDGATMTINHSIALNAADKVFQHNAKGGATTVVKNSYISTFGKLWRSCGDCTANGGPRHLVLNNVKVEGIGVCVAGANENYGDTVTITNLFVKGGYDAAKDKPKICQVYEAVTDHNGSSTKLYDGASQWDSKTCVVSKSDVKSY